MGVCNTSKKKDKIKNQTYQRNNLGNDYNNQEINNEYINLVNYNNDEINFQYQLNNENDCNKNIQLLKTRCKNKISELTKKHNEEIKNLKDKYNKSKEKIEEDYNKKIIYYKEQFETKKKNLPNIKKLTEQENISLKFNMNKNKSDLMKKNIKNEEEYQNNLKNTDKIFLEERKKEFNNYIKKKKILFQIIKYY